MPMHTSRILNRVATFALLGAAIAVPMRAVHAAPRQIVVVVAEGLNPQLIDFGTAYTKTAYEEGTTVAFDTLKAEGKSSPVGADIVANMKGILKTAAANGYRTGLVTTEDVSKVAPLFYDVAGNASAIASANFNFLSGGGRTGFSAEAAKTIVDGGGTTIMDVEAMDADIKGKTLVLQSDAGLNYALDRDVEKEAGFAEQVTLALQTLSADDAPFFLVVHDTLLKKALDAKDTPAAVEQFRELDGIVADILGNREANGEQFAMALVATGAGATPRFTTELPNQRSDAFYILSQLPMSYGKAGTTLQGADDAKMTDFATNQYKGWKLSPENKAAIAAGTMTPEAALRASYEPALNIAFEPVAATPMVHVVGMDAGNDLVGALKNLASMKPAAAPAP